MIVPHAASGTIHGSSTIVIAREDFSIPGAAIDVAYDTTDPSEIERNFFRLIDANQPDVIVLHLTCASDRGIEAIRKIRDRCGVPILVVHASGDGRANDYRTCGAADCVTAPVDIVALNQSIQHIIKLTRRDGYRNARLPEAITFAGIVFWPNQNVLRGPIGGTVKLTTLENQVLALLVARAQKVCCRSEIAQVVYGNHPASTDRAIDVLVNRLRKKLSAASGEAGENLVKTEFRRGYVFVANVSIVPSMAGS